MKSKTNKPTARATRAGFSHDSAASRRIQLESAMICASLLAMVTGASAQTAQSASASSASTQPAFSFFPEKPDWLTDLGVSAKESYDDNIYGVSGKVAAEKHSWISTVAPTLGVNLAPLFGDASVVKALALGYSPEVNIFHNAPSENYTAHRFAQTLKAQAGDFSVNLENGLNYIDGNDKAPVYSGDDSQRSAYATAMPRERREQIQDRSKISIQYDQPQWFARLAGSLLSYDLLTDLSTQTGYQNYASRYDVNGGVDFGYKVTSDFAVTLGYRYGHQYQQTFPEAIDDHQWSATSDYQRVLLGVEGSPWKWLTLSAQAGPDFRSYDSSAPVLDDNTTTYYGEASATANISDNDKLSLRYKQWRWVSSTGKVPYNDSLYELGYKRKLTSQLAWDLTGRIQSSDYSPGNAGATSVRNDYLYTLATGLTFAVNRNLSFNASYSLDLARNSEQSGTYAADYPYREYNRNLASLSTTFKW
jgi:hypothetical protein